MISLQKIILKPLCYECKLFLKIAKPKVVFVCGNIGKSTTVEFSKSVLSKQFKVRSTYHYKSNNKLDVILAILGIKTVKKIRNLLYPYYLIMGFFKSIFCRKQELVLVLEIQIEKSKDADFFNSFIKPDIILFTSLPEKPEFYSNFLSTKDFLSENFKVLENVKSGGKIIYLKDEITSKYLNDNRRSDVTYMSCGEKDSDFIHKEHKFEFNQEDCTAISYAKFCFSGSSGVFDVSGLGVHLPSLMSLVVALANDLNIEVFKSTDLFHNHKPLPHRLAFLPARNGITIVDNSYGKTLCSSISAINTVKKIKGKEKVFVVLDDMKTLGKYKEEVHIDLLNEYAQEFDRIIIHGEESKKAFADSENVLNVYYFKTIKKITNFLSNHTSKGNMVLIDGFPVVKSKKIVKELSDN